MGYKISSLKSLPVIPGVDLYVFVIGQHKWAGGYAEIIEDNFARLAQHLGERGAIVAGHDGVNVGSELSHELAKAGQHNETVHELIAKGESLGLSILLVGSHPRHLTDNDLFLLAAIDQINNNFGSLDQFFSELCEFSVNRNVSFLNKFEERTKAPGGLSDFLEIKPNMFGLGININAMINRWRER